MKEFWESVFKQSQKQLVFFMKKVGEHDYGTEYVLKAMDHTFDVCATFIYGTSEPRPMDRSFVRLAFKCDYDYDYPSVFESEAELKAQGLSRQPLSVIMSQDENGNSVPLPTAILCGKITAIKELGGAHIFEVEYGDKTFPVVFLQEKPNADVGDILYGEFDVLARISSFSEK